MSPSGLTIAVTFPPTSYRFFVKPPSRIHLTDVPLAKLSPLPPKLSNLSLQSRETVGVTDGFGVNVELGFGFSLVEVGVDLTVGVKVRVCVRVGIVVGISVGNNPTETSAKMAGGPACSTDSTTPAADTALTSQPTSKPNIKNARQAPGRFLRKRSSSLMHGIITDQFDKIGKHDIIRYSMAHAASLGNQGKEEGTFDVWKLVKSNFRGLLLVATLTGGFILWERSQPDPSAVAAGLTTDGKAVPVSHTISASADLGTPIKQAEIRSNVNSPDMSATEFANYLVKKALFVDQKTWGPENIKSVENDLHVVVIRALEMGVPKQRLQEVFSGLVLFENSQTYDLSNRKADVLINTLYYYPPQKEWRIILHPSSSRTVIHEVAGHIFCGSVVDRPQGNLLPVSEACAEAVSREMGVSTGNYDPEVIAWYKFENSLKSAGGKFNRLTETAVHINTEWVTPTKPNEDKNGVPMLKGNYLAQIAKELDLNPELVNKIASKYPILWRNKK